MSKFILTANELEEYQGLSERSKEKVGHNAVIWGVSNFEAFKMMKSLEQWQ